MRELPILFSAPMVRAILEGRKTMTRRVVKPQPSAGIRNSPFVPSGLEDGHGREIRSPYGKPGDRLWSRETWLPDAPRDGTWDDVSFYGCKGSPLSWIPKRYRKPEHCLFKASWTGFEITGWKPSIHMPRWASRITLEVTDVRVDRLQDIGAEDCIAEGLSTSLREHDAVCDLWDQYCGLWESLNGAGSWGANPWVWVISFKRIEVAHG